MKAPKINPQSPLGEFEAAKPPVAMHLSAWHSRREQLLHLAPILAVLILAIPFIRPFFAPTFPDSGDGLLNLYRVVALDAAIQHGDLWPRFMTALHYGYGSPIFNYYAPLSIYGVEAVHLLGWDAPDSYRIAMILYALIGAVGAYLLGKAAAGRIAGIVTAAAYLYAPPLFDTFNRTGQFAAILLLPYVLWAFWSLAVHRRRRDFVLAALLFAALLLTHNVTALYAAPMAALWAIYAGWRTGGDRLRALGLPVLALLAALGLTAFFWWPALAEADFVQLHRLDIPQFDYHTNFLPLTQTFALTTESAARIGWPQVILGLVGLIMVLIPLSPRVGTVTVSEVSPRDWAIFAASVFIIAIFFTTRASVWLWDHLPLVDLLLFPSRLLYGASLMIALLAGIGAAMIAGRIPSQVGQAAWVILCLGLLIAVQLPLLRTNPVEKPAAATIHDIHDFERNTGWIGATSAGEFLPIGVNQMPHAWALTDRLYVSSTPPRLKADPAIVTVRSESWGLKSAEVAISVSQPTTLIFEWMYFPGWQATLDGQPAELRASDPEGLIALDVPSGDHVITLRFARTPIRRYAEWVSIATLVVLVVGIGVHMLISSRA